MLRQNRDKRNLLTEKQHKLLDNAMLSRTSTAQNMSKAKVTKSAKRAPKNDNKYYTILGYQCSFLAFLVCKTFGICEL